jgi:hypothetical protein
MEIGVDCAWGVGYSEVSADSEVVENRQVTHRESISTEISANVYEFSGAARNRSFPIRPGGVNGPR